MQKQKIVIKHPEGFHMRPATEFVNGLLGIESSVTFVIEGKQINAKSLLNLIAAGIKCGQEIEVVCEGSDESVALKKAIELIEKH